MKPAFELPVVVVAALISSMLIACTAPGPPEDLAQRRPFWFSYLNGDDMRRRCRPGGPDQYRLVYNAIYTEQVRAYDLAPIVGGDSWMVETRVFEPVNFASLEVQLSRPLAALDAKTSRVRAGADLVEELAEELRRNDFESPAPRGRFLRSDSFYWIAAACRDGRFKFNTWPADSESFADRSFLTVLAPYDDTGVPVNAVRRQTLFPIIVSDEEREIVESGEGPLFQVQVGKNGLKL